MKVISTLKGLRLVRINAQSAKLPQCWQATDAESTQWPSGLFAWPDQADADSLRTAFSLKAKPVTVQKAAKTMNVSRHPRPGTNEPQDDGARRASSQLEEMCAVFLQPEDLGEPLRMIDLADRWRDLHTAYPGETRLPFPLHELRLIERAIVGDME